MKTGDLQIPTSYGHLSAKTWGTDGEDRLRVLAVHGWQDNAGTFNRLFPLLDHLNRLYIVALDLPGHGRSSHLPKGVPYTDMTWVIELKRTIDYLGWNGLSSSSASSSASSFFKPAPNSETPFPQERRHHHRPLNGRQCRRRAGRSLPASGAHTDHAGYCEAARLSYRKPRR